MPSKIFVKGARENNLKNVDVEIPRDTGDFRLVDRKVIDVINSLPEHNKFLRGLFSWVGFKQTPFEYERKERFAGKTKYPLKKMLKLAKDGIFSFSIKPLKIVGTMGTISIAISLIILIYAILSYIFDQFNSGVDIFNGNNDIFKWYDTYIFMDDRRVYRKNLWWNKEKTTIYNRKDF